MKNFAKLMLLSVSMFLLLQAAALANTGKTGTEYTIDGECTFKINSVQAYDMFFNQDSGTGKQWIVVSFDLLNWRTDSFYVKTETAAQVIYDGDYEYEPDHLWPNPEGSYYSQNAKDTLYIYEMNESGQILSNGTDSGNGYAKTEVTFHSGYARMYDPINNVFYYWKDGPENPWSYQSTDSSKTVLDPLVERTYHYVFLVPDLVAEDEGLRELVFTVCDEEYYFRF